MGRRVEVVRATRERRASLLRANKSYPSAPAQSAGGGRLLVYNPDWDLWDGAAELESGGFFDADNCPPWDVWVAYATPPDDGRLRVGSAWRPWSSYLIAWAPPECVAVVTAGILVNPECCVVWAAALDSPLTTALRRLGLV